MTFPAVLWGGQGGSRQGGSDPFISLQPLMEALSLAIAVATSGSTPDSVLTSFLLPVCNNDSLSISKSPPCKNSFGIENSLSTSSEVQGPPPPPASWERDLGRDQSSAVQCSDVMSSS